MRIISGQARGKRLTTFTGGTIRPTPDKVRGAVFSILFSRIGSMEGKRVLDLFAGSGAMGLEALSRGAASALLVDQSPQSAKVVVSNLRHCGFEDRAALMRAEVLAALPRLAKENVFDLIFLDPPYGQGLVDQVVGRISELKLLRPGGVVCAEAARQDEVSDTVGDLVQVDHRTYGATAVYLFMYPEPGNSLR